MDDDSIGNRERTSRRMGNAHRHSPPSAAHLRVFRVPLQQFPERPRKHTDQPLQFDLARPIPEVEGALQKSSK